MRYALSALVLLALTSQASAHAFLKTATPAVGGQVHQPPVEVAITFTEGVEPKFSSISVKSAAGQVVDNGAPHLEGGDTVLAVPLTALQPGTYTVTWHATATDTHKTEGNYTFTVTQ